MVVTIVATNAQAMHVMYLELVSDMVRLIGIAE